MNKVRKITGHWAASGIRAVILLILFTIAAAFIPAPVKAKSGVELDKYWSMTKEGKFNYSYIDDYGVERKVELTRIRELWYKDGDGRLYFYAYDNITISENDLPKNVPDDYVVHKDLGQVYMTSMKVTAYPDFPKMEVYESMNYPDGTVVVAYDYREEYAPDNGKKSTPKPTPKPVKTTPPEKENEDPNADQAPDRTPKPSVTAVQPTTSPAMHPTLSPIPTPSLITSTTPVTAPKAVIASIDIPMPSPTDKIVNGVHEDTDALATLEEQKKASDRNSRLVLAGFIVVPGLILAGAIILYVRMKDPAKKGR